MHFESSNGNWFREGRPRRYCSAPFPPADCVGKYWQIIRDQQKWTIVSICGINSLREWNFSERSLRWKSNWNQIKFDPAWMSRSTCVCVFCNTGRLIKKMKHCGRVSSHEMPSRGVRGMIDFEWRKKCNFPNSYWISQLKFKAAVALTTTKTSLKKTRQQSRLPDGVR